jgi:hypothetical protein
MSSELAKGDPCALPYAIEFSNAFFKTLSLGLATSNSVLLSLSALHLSIACWSGALYYFKIPEID